LRRDMEQRLGHDLFGVRVGWLVTSLQRRGNQPSMAKKLKPMARDPQFKFDYVTSAVSLLAQAGQGDGIVVHVVNRALPPDSPFSPRHSSDPTFSQ